MVNPFLARAFPTDPETLESAVRAQGLAKRGNGIERREALLEVDAMLPDMIVNQGIKKPRRAAERSPRSTRICPKGFSFSSTQAFIASTRASLVMKSI
ncbi:MAG: hypothetical protein NVSMB9_22630 [Isosphaeraceae bacterium]